MPYCPPFSRTLLSTSFRSPPWIMMLATPPPSTQLPTDVRTVHQVVEVDAPTEIVGGALDAIVWMVVLIGVNGSSPPNR